MDIDVLKHYLTIIEEGSLVKAAERLTIAQPTLTVQLKKLEEEGGGTLMHRNRKGISLTPSGMAFKTKAEEILRLVDDSKKEVINIEHHITGELRIGSGESMAFSVLSKCIGELHQAHEDIVFRLEYGDTNTQLYC